MTAFLTFGRKIKGAAPIESGGWFLLRVTRRLLTDRSGLTSPPGSEPPRQTDKNEAAAL